MAERQYSVQFIQRLSDKMRHDYNWYITSLYQKQSQCQHRHVLFQERYDLEKAADILLFDPHADISKLLKKTYTYIIPRISYTKKGERRETVEKIIVLDREYLEWKDIRLDILEMRRVSEKTYIATQVIPSKSLKLVHDYHVNIKRLKPSTVIRFWEGELEFINQTIIVP